MPVLRLTARKAGDPVADLRARLHRAFVVAGVVDPLTASPHLAHLESIVDKIVAAVQALPHQGTSACLATVLGATARHDPRLARLAIEILLTTGLVAADDATSHLRLAASLEDEAFPARLAAYLRRHPGPPGTQTLRLRRLDDQASLYLAAGLHPDAPGLHRARTMFQAATSPLTATDREISFFCAETVAWLSRRETARGIRAFARGDLSRAGRHLETAVAYDADNPLPLWNLARLALARGRRLEALDHYAALLELAPAAGDALRAEMDAATGRSPGELHRWQRPVRQGAGP
jgi:tetratricopeptide (TPR) repeat protein